MTKTDAGQEENLNIMIMKCFCEADILRGSKKVKMGTELIDLNPVILSACRQANGDAACYAEMCISPKLW